MAPTDNSGQATATDKPGEFYEVLVSCYDGTDFDGDWRYSAFCPDIDAAMDGRTPAEALSRVKEAIRIKIGDYPTGQFPMLPPAARAKAVEDFLNEDRLVDKTTVLLEPEAMPGLCTHV